MKTETRKQKQDRHFKNMHYVLTHDYKKIIKAPKLQLYHLSTSTEESEDLLILTTGNIDAISEGLTFHIDFLRDHVSKITSDMVTEYLNRNLAESFTVFKVNDINFINL